MTTKPRYVALLGLTSLILILIFNAFMLNYNLFRCFNMSDMGAFLDAGYRVFRGQHPYRDFFYHSGPIHLYLTAGFFQLFGFGKSAILIHIILVSSVVIIINFFMAWRILPIFLTILVTFLTSASFYIPASFPWYDHTAHLWGIFAILIIAYNIAEQKSHHWPLISFLTGCLTILAFLSKTNIGVAYAVAFFIYWIVIIKRLKVVLYYGAGILLSAIISLILMPHSEEYLQQAIFIYALKLTDRLENFFAVPDLPKSYILIGTIVMLNAWRQMKNLSHYLLLFLLLVGIAVFSIKSGSLGSANTLLRGFVMTFAFILLHKVTTQRARKNLTDRLSVILLILLCFYFSFRSIQYGIERGIWIKSAKQIGSYKLKSEPLDGWLFGKEDGEKVDHIVEYIKSNIPREKTLLILGDHSIIYALAGRDSYKGVFFLFTTPLIVKAPSLQVKMRQNLNHNPPDFIITYIKKGSEHLLDASDIIIPDEFALQYQLLEVWNDFGIFRRKNVDCLDRKQCK